MLTVLAVPIIFLAVILADGYEEGATVFDLMACFSSWVEKPYMIHYRPHTPKFVLVALIIYGMCIALYVSGKENRRPGEEYGSASWGNPHELSKTYADKNGDNVILTQNVSIGLDGRKHMHNLNILVVGGSGAGKTGDYECELFVFNY